VSGVRRWGTPFDGLDFANGPGAEGATVVVVVDVVVDVVVVLDVVDVLLVVVVDPDDPSDATAAAALTMPAPQFDVVHVPLAGNGVAVVWRAASTWSWVSERPSSSKATTPDT
jgi:hypothetical protein